jgi:transposase
MSIAHSYIGIDVARARLDIFDDQGGARAIANAPAAIAAFVERLAGRSVTVVFEATGAYDRALRAALAAARIKAIRVNPGRARDFARAAGYLAKTDAVDARMLAAMARAIDLPPHEPVEPQREELNALARQRDWLVQLRAEEKTRLPQATAQAVRTAIETHIAWLDQQIRALEAALETLIGATPDLRATKRLLQTAPGVGPVTAAVLIAQMPELAAGRPRPSPPSPAWPRSTTTAATSAAAGRSRVAAGVSAAPSTWPPSPPSEPFRDSLWPTPPSPNAPPAKKSPSSLSHASCSSPSTP